MTSDVATIATVVGEADVLQRLALVVDCVDADTRRRCAAPLRIGWEVSPRLLGRGYDPAWPCLDLPSKGPARAALLLDTHTPRKAMVVRVVDPGRRFVARRFGLKLWTLDEVVPKEGGLTAVRGLSRLLRPWLLPGPASTPSRGLTTIRGAVQRANRQPARWARVTAIGPGNHAVGWAHADERGEFLLVIVDTGTLPPPAPTDLQVRLVVTARSVAHPAAVDPQDPYADLVIERVLRSSDPPTPAELENDVLRGRAIPLEYLPSAGAATTVTAKVGQQVVLAAPLPFGP